MGITLFRRSSPSAEAIDEQSELCADDLRRLVEIERGQRLLLQNAYEDTVVALARALESKDSGTGAHSQRVQRYALELADAVAPELLGNASAEHGFLLHDVGKIGIPDRVLRKPGPLDPEERRLMETHTLVGERMLSDVSLLRGEGLKVVRSHHERWDGLGYPDRLAGDEIPIGARVFAVADTLDAFTSDRPYRAAGSWEDASRLIVSEANAQFDPGVVEAFREREQAMRSLQLEFARLAALN
jgi:HD-GYP domain-containing protein (c-di-GMP phosphodiesterase class II)